MSIVSVTVGRASLSKSDIVISDDGATYRFTQGGLGYVIQSVRTTTAPDSVNVDGSEITGFARNATGLLLEFHIFGSSSADVEAAKADLDEAFYRLDYPVTRTVDGASVAYSGGPCALVPARGGVESGVLAEHFDTFSVTIPFPNPNGV